MASPEILALLSKVEAIDELLPGFHNILVSLRRKYPEEQSLRDAADIVRNWSSLVEQSSRLPNPEISSLAISLNCMILFVDQMKQFRLRIREDDVSSQMALALMRNRIDAALFPES